jgi:hypothetical protein
MGFRMKTFILSFCVVLFLGGAKVLAATSVAAPPLATIDERSAKSADAKIVSAVVDIAAESTTYMDFVNRTFTNPEARADAASYLDSLLLADSRMVALKADGNTFVVGTFGGDLRAEFEAQPRPLARVLTRVIYLDRPVKLIANDLADAVKSKMFGASGYSILFPRAHADDDYNRAVAALATGLRAAQVRSVTAPIAPASALEEVQANVCEVGYQFDCVDKKADGRDYRVNITMPGGGFFSRYRLDGFKKDATEQAPASVSTSSYTLKKYWSEWDSNPCTFSIKDGNATKPSPPSCGQGALMTLRSTNKKATRADAVIPKIAIAALIRCCSEDSQCHRKLKDCVNRAGKSDRLNNSPRPRQAPAVH